MLTLQEKQHIHTVCKDFNPYDDKDLFSVSGIRKMFSSEEDAASYCVKVNLSHKLHKLLADNGRVTIKIQYTRMYHVVRDSILEEAHNARADVDETFGLTNIKFTDGLEDYGYAGWIIEKLLDNQVVCFEIK